MTTGNTIGFSGYVFNREIDAGGLYTVRFRHYDPVWGRWISRDPAGYADSMSLYGYGWSGPLSTLDPYGLWGWDGGWVEGFLTGAWHGIVMIADNITGHLIPGLNDYADEIRAENDTWWYRAGDWSGLIGGLLLPPAAFVRLFGWGGAVFRTAINKNRYFRIGWSRVGSGASAGQKIFRVAVGGANGRSMHILEHVFLPWYQSPYFYGWFILRTLWEFLAAADDDGGAQVDNQGDSGAGQAQPPSNTGGPTNPQSEPGEGSGSGSPQCLGSL